jgi:hypothetical protein
VHEREVIIDRRSWGAVAEWQADYDNAIADMLKGEANLQSLDAI